MRKLIVTALSLLISVLGFSQTNKIENGTYQANYQGETVNLIVEDGKFHLSIVSGDFQLKKDSIFFVNLNKKKSGFSLNYAFDSYAKTDKIKVVVADYTISTNTLFIGTQTSKSAVKFQSLTKIQEELAGKNLAGSSEDTVAFELDKTAFITLVSEDAYNEKTEISKFKVPENINVITINYAKLKVDNINLNGVYNEKNKELILKSNGKSPLTFKLSKDIKDESVEPTETTIQKRWTYEGKPAPIVESTIETVQTASDTVMGAIQPIDEGKVYKFAHFRSISFNESLTRIAKTPKKFLVVAFDLKNVNRQGEFETFLMDTETSIGGYMYNEYNAEYDFFDFYLATDKDKNLLKKYDIKSDKVFLIFNATGDLIYYTESDLISKAQYFGVYNNAQPKLEKANQKLEFDKVIFDKKATDSAFLDILSKMYVFDVENAALKALPIDDIKTDQMTPADAAKIAAEDAPTMTDKEKEELSASFPPPVIEAKADYSDYYEVIKDRKNLYELKSTYALVYEKWQKLVTKYQKSKVYDAQFILILKQELNNEGFSKKSFGQDNSQPKPIDFEILDYVFANYDKIDQDVLPQDVVMTPIKVVEDSAAAAVEAAADAVVGMPDEQDYVASLNTVLENYFERTTNVEYRESPKLLSEKVLTYYKKYVELQKYKSGITRRYLNVLANYLDKPEPRKEYFRVFEVYFDNIMRPNKSVIENLDLDFSDNLDNESSWISYKNNFATDCNQVAWEIVKIEKDKALVAKATKWSEISVEIEKKTHYFFDTLARLYYLNGQKEKAIATQQKAIDFGEGTEQLEEYKMVLDLMKNNTYTLPVSKD
jgi:hypothetical protein